MKCFKIIYLITLTFHPSLFPSPFTTIWFKPQRLKRISDTSCEDMERLKIAVGSSCTALTRPSDQRIWTELMAFSLMSSGARVIRLHNRTSGNIRRHPDPSLLELLLFLLLCRDADKTNCSFALLIKFTELTLEDSCSCVII